MPLQLLAEIKIHKSLSHPYIVGFESYFEDEANVYIMLELCPNQVRAVRPYQLKKAACHCVLQPSHSSTPVLPPFRSVCADAYGVSAAAQAAHGA